MKCLLNCDFLAVDYFIVPVKQSLSSSPAEIMVIWWCFAGRCILVEATWVGGSVKSTLCSQNESEVTFLTVLDWPRSELPAAPLLMFLALVTQQLLLPLVAAIIDSFVLWPWFPHFHPWPCPWTCRRKWRWSCTTGQEKRCRDWKGESLVFSPSVLSTDQGKVRYLSVQV